MEHLIYFDHAATTPVCPQAVEAAVEAMTREFGNPSSRYDLGGQALARMEAHRQTVAQALGCKAQEVVFTSCGTEGDSWAIRAAVELGKRRGKHIITTSIEHHAVLHPLAQLEQEGYEVTYLKPDKSGHISVEQVESALREDTILVSMMLVNNEIGTLMPVAEVGAMLKARKSAALFHCDAIQGFLKVPFTPAQLGVDFLAISGHKIRAPKGIGALYIRQGLKVKPWLLGGGQENGLRSGTQPTAQIAALAAACAAWQGGESNTLRISEVKKYFLESFSTKIPGGVVLNEGDAPHICAVSLPGYPSEMLVRELSDRGICLSSGSACHRGKASHVFASLGRGKLELMGALRVSFSFDNTRDEVDALVAALLDITQTRMAVR